MSGQRFPPFSISLLSIHFHLCFHTHLPIHRPMIMAYVRQQNQAHRHDSSLQQFLLRLSNSTKRFYAAYTTLSIRNTSITLPHLSNIFHHKIHPHFAIYIARPRRLRSPHPHHHIRVRNVPSIRTCVLD